MYKSNCCRLAILLLLGAILILSFWQDAIWAKPSRNLPGFTGDPRLFSKVAGIDPFVTAFSGIEADL